MILDSLPKSCKYRENLMFWRLRIPKKILDSLPKSCIYSESEATWRIRIQKMILDIPWKPNGLEAKDPREDFGFTSKIMQIPWKPGGLEDQDPNSYISKITFVSWIRGFCGQLSHPWSVHLDVDRSWSVLKRNFCNFNLFWRLLTFSDNCANLTFFHFHNSVGDCKHSATSHMLPRKKNLYSIESTHNAPSNLLLQKYPDSRIKMYALEFLVNNKSSYGIKIKVYSPRQKMIFREMCFVTSFWTPWSPHFFHYGRPLRSCFHSRNRQGENK